MTVGRLVLANLMRRKVRTLLTILCIVVAFVLFGYLSAIRQALSQGVDVADADRLVVRHKVSLIQPLPASYEAEIEQLPGVAQVAHASWFGGIYQKPSNFFAQAAVQPEDWLSIYPEYLLSDEEKEAWFRTRTGAVVGRATAERFGWKVGDRIPIQATAWTHNGGNRLWEFDLVGIYDGAKPGTDTSWFFFHYDFFDEARDFGRGIVGWYVVRIEDPRQAADVAKRIDQTFANSPAETKAETEGAFLQSFADQIGNIGAIVIAILSAVFFTILLVAGNTMAQSVRERIGELAVLKAIGFNDTQVVGLILAEACAIAGIGGLLGLGVGWFAISLGDPTSGALPVFFFPTADLLLGVGLALGLGFVTGSLPALQAGRLRIAHALRRLG
ncbi:MAG TPA: FtsX-like permease family protein [Vicinamibacteria bacterium]|nr:FtsX-like permease family protein [Vicinamibacteria bacterium]